MHLQNICNSENISQGNYLPFEGCLCKYKMFMERSFFNFRPRKSLDRQRENISGSDVPSSSWFGKEKIKWKAKTSSCWWDFFYRCRHRWFFIILFAPMDVIFSFVVSHWKCANCNITILQRNYQNHKLWAKIYLFITLPISQTQSTNTDL